MHETSKNIKSLSKETGTGIKKSQMEILEIINDEHRLKFKHTEGIGFIGE
jgi:hypothetical protein